MTLQGFNQFSRQKHLYLNIRVHFKNNAPTRFEKSTHLNQIRFMLYHERECEIKENANFVHIVYLLAKLCNIFCEEFFIDVSILHKR